MALAKFIPLGFEKSNGLQIQIQAFNVFNHPQFTSWNTNFTNSAKQFGIPTADNNARILSLNIRYQF